MIEISEEVKSNIKTWLNGLEDCQIDKVFNIPQHQVIVTVEFNYGCRHAAIDIQVIRNSDYEEVPFDGLATSPLEDDWLLMMDEKENEGRAWSNTMDIINSNW
jgi:hypothetical protein